MRRDVRLFLCLARTCAALAMQTLAQGLVQGWASPGVTKLEDGEGPFLPTTSQVTWIVSVWDLGLLAGSVVCFFVFARTGRRQTLALSPLFYLAWCALTYFAQSAAYLYAARFFGGIAMSINFTFTAIYICEVGTPAQRGVMVLVMSVVVSVGQLLTYVLSPYVSYWTLALVPVPPLVLALLLTPLWTQETPYYLVMCGREAAALRGLRRLRAGLPEEEVRLEAAAIEQSVRAQLREAATWRQALAPPGTKRAAGIVLLLTGCPSLSGVDVVLSYTQTIFKESGTVLTKILASEMVVSVRVVMTVLAMYPVRALGRRPHLASAAFINGLSMTAMAWYFLAKEHLGWSVVRVEWLPLVALMVFMAASGGGVIPLPHIIMGELLSQQAKKVVAPTAAIVNAATTFAISKCFLLVGDAVGFCVPFAFFMVMNYFIGGFTLLCLPESRGRTLAEVQEELARGRRAKPTYTGGDSS